MQAFSLHWASQPSWRVQDHSSVLVSPVFCSAVVWMKYNEINRVITLKSKLVGGRKSLYVESQEDHEFSVQVSNRCAPPNSF